MGDALAPLPPALGPLVTIVFTIIDGGQRTATRNWYYVPHAGDHVDLEVDNIVGRVTRVVYTDEGVWVDLR